MTTLYDSQDIYFAIDDTGAVLRDMSPYITRHSGLPGQRPTLDATTVNDGSRKRHPSLREARIRLEVMWSDDASVGPDTVFGPLLDYETAVDWEYGPKGSTSGYTKYYGTCFVVIFDITGAVGSMLLATVEIDVHGDITRTTFT